MNCRMTTDDYTLASWSLEVKASFSTRLLCRDSWSPLLFRILQSTSRISMGSKPKDSKPLSLGDTLRDLALLRASDVDLSSLLPVSSLTTSDSSKAESNVSVQRSYEFVREARTAIKMHDRADAAIQGDRLETVRNKLEDLLKGLDDSKVTLHINLLDFLS